MGSRTASNRDLRNPPQCVILCPEVIGMDSKCIPFQGTLNNRGYGMKSRNGRNHCAHRLAYLDAGGTIPDGWVVDHLCGNPSCINPAHLKACTQSENVSRGMKVAGSTHNAAKTHCKNGHELSGDNLLVESGGAGRKGRRCRACRRIREARYRKEKR